MTALAHLLKLHLTTFSVIRTADSHISTSRPSKVRNTELPDEYNLERFLRNVGKQHDSWRVENPVSMWDGVTCNMLGIVHSTCISWTNRDLTGTFRWEYMPKSTVAFDVQQNRLSGEVRFELLPPSLESLNLARNMFFGPIDLRFAPGHSYCVFRCDE